MEALQSIWRILKNRGCCKGASFILPSSVSVPDKFGIDRTQVLHLNKLYIHKHSYRFIHVNRSEAGHPGRMKVKSAEFYQRGDSRLYI